jgi:hypothetical protein
MVEYEWKWGGIGRVVWRQRDGWRRLDLIPSVDAQPDLGAFIVQHKADDGSFATVSCSWLRRGGATLLEASCGEGYPPSRDGAVFDVLRSDAIRTMASRTILARNASCYSLDDGAEACLDADTAIPLAFVIASGTASARQELTASAVTNSPAPLRFPVTLTRNPVTGDSFAEVQVSRESLDLP